MNRRKSTYSGDNGGACVEIASTPGHIHIRDTTNRNGLTLIMPAAVWTELITTIR
jgi:hypothetical protein